MKEMVEVINGNLLSLINGITEHRKDIEKDLSTINNEVDLKIETTAQYKDDIDTAHNQIANIEQEINELKKDLKDLVEKFETKNLDELLTVAEKEINAQVELKQGAISEQELLIDDITKKTQGLKKELGKLKQRKAAFENELSKIIILENYYGKRINSVINFANEHPEELETYKEVDQVDSLSTDDIEDINIDNIMDGQVFQEIASISGDTNEKLSVNELIDTFDQVFDRTPEILETGLDDTKVEESVDEEKEELSYDINDTDNLVTDAEELIFGSSLEEKLNESKNQPDVFEVQLDEVEDKNKKGIRIHRMSEPITVNLDAFDIENNLQNKLNEDINNDDFNKNLEECGLNATDFAKEDLDLLKDNFDLDKTKEFIEVLNKHEININKIYDSVKVLIEVSPSDLDNILTLLKGVSTVEDVLLIFRYLYKVNISKLEQNISVSDDASLAELLISTIDSEENANLSNLLDISKKDVENISKNFADDYQLMINFPEIVFANYNALKAYNIDNLNECIIKHPHRFTFNPSKFSEILDKYDAEDLVRCINKNSAVIDKL